MNFLMSPPCGGKTTQGKLLLEGGVKYVDVSDLLKLWMAARPDSPAVIKAAQVIKLGGNVDNIIINNLVAEHLKRVQTEEHFVGGFPRDLGQATYALGGLVDLMRDEGVKIVPRFYLIDTPREVCLHRKTAAKSDKPSGESDNSRGERIDGDKHDVFLRRLKDHFERIPSITGYIDRLCSVGVIRIDGTMPQEKILEGLRSTTFA